MTDTALQSPPPRAAERRKAALVCPGCGRTDPLDGSWIAHDTDDHTRYVCPDCGTTVVTQPRL